MVWNIIPTKMRISFSIPLSICDTTCSLCSYPMDSLYHLFFTCPIARIVWRQSFWCLDSIALPIADMIDWIHIILNPGTIGILIYVKYLLPLLVIVFGLHAIKLFMIILFQMHLSSLLLLTGLLWNIILPGLQNAHLLLLG
jgi:hypothetical protein